MNKYKNKIMLGILLLFFIISIGFALLTTTLNIEGNTTAKGNTWNIYFDNIQVKTGSITPVQAATINPDNKTQLSFNVNLNIPGDFYEFNVDVKNEGTLDAMIDTFEILPVLTTEQAKIFNYTVKYSNGTKLKQKDLLASKTKETLTVRIEFNKNVTNEDLSGSNTTISPSITINYVQATETNKKPEGPAVLKATSRTDTTAFRTDEYKQKIKTITFEDEINVPSNAVESWDIGEKQNGNVMAYLSTNADDSTMYDLHIQSDEQLYANEDMSYWFYKLEAVDSINGIELLDTSNVTDMSRMFENCWTQSTNDLILNLSSWDTSKVNSMYQMFSGIGYNAENVELDLSNWDTGKVTDMSNMFAGNRDNYYTYKYSLGANATSLVLKGLDNWDTSNVENMQGLFYGLGYGATTWNIGNLSNWNTSKATDMSKMFNFAGYTATTFNPGDLSGWDTGNVTNMSLMFCAAGRMSKTFDVGNVGNWNVSKVIDISGMFSNTGENATTFNIGNLSEWNTGNVTNMARMFNQTGYTATTWDIGDIGNWDTSKVTSMSNMFNQAGYTATIWNVGDLSNWNTSNVTNMQNMFLYAGYSASTKVNPNVSGWNVNKVTNHTNFNGSATWITPPTWVN